jgi:hypothetical protein
MFLGELAKLRTTTASFLRPHRPRLPVHRFHESLHLRIFRKYVKKIQFLLKHDILHVTTYAHLQQFLSQFLK